MEKFKNKHLDSQILFKASALFLKQKYCIYSQNQVQGVPHIFVCILPVNNTLYFGEPSVLCFCSYMYAEDD